MAVKLKRGSEGRSDSCQGTTEQLEPGRRRLTKMNGHTAELCYYPTRPAVTQWEQMCSLTFIDSVPKCELKQTWSGSSVSGFRGTETFSNDITTWIGTEMDGCVGVHVGGSKTLTLTLIKPIDSTPELPPSIRRHLPRCCCSSCHHCIVSRRRVQCPVSASPGNSIHFTYGWF